MKESIEKVHADLVFLQEVLGRHDQHGSRVRDWPNVSQFEFLADRLWPHHAYGKNAIYTSGHHGNAILSKYPIIFSENVDISTNKLERRGLLHAVIEVLFKPLHVICLHLGLFEAGRRIQLNHLCKRIDLLVPHHQALIIAGDFNDWRGSATKVLRERLGVQEVFVRLNGDHARTFPSWLPTLKLDRIYFRALSPFSAEVMTDGVWGKLSDHAAVYAQFSMA